MGAKWAGHSVEIRLWKRALRHDGYTAFIGANRSRAFMQSPMPKGVARSQVPFVVVATRTLSNRPANGATSCACTKSRTRDQLDAALSHISHD